MSHINKLLNSLSQTLRYPIPDTKMLVIKLEKDLTEFDTKLARFLNNSLQYFENSTLPEQEELYTSTFDLSPKTFPYAAFHIWGDNYKRGLLMAGLKSTYAEYGIEILNELPDYIPLLLNLYTRINDSEKANSLRDELLIPALKNMESELKKTTNVYSEIIEVITRLLEKTKE